MNLTVSEQHSDPKIRIDYEFELKAYEYALKLHNNKSRCAIVVGAKFSNLSFFAPSGMMPLDEMFDRLKKRLLTYGEIGSRYENSSVGCCAEVNAANQIYHKHNSIELNEIILSKAYRPRTMQCIDKCQICKEIFLKDVD